MANKIQRITPWLSFDTQAEEAANFYVSIFPNSAIETRTRYTDAGPRPKGSVMTVGFRLDGQQFTALNGGPEFNFNQGISFLVACDTQHEVDRYWEKLSHGGKTLECGWLKDKFGLSWQVTPVALLEMIQDKDPAKVERVMKAMMQMKKLDIATLEKAYGEKGVPEEVKALR